ncbi:CubicO group peptidase, beta-lactamase class C family [Reichenbachiella faecimaris]|uniref:CubicO group peptidase, beta-lactamase class C family n=1 Tax=Reichenbachiella faecimaris TaxID=692418 RepID=A0A1W2G7K9_REIFA|nr:serine hydrolase domain-containing protein [Reichenbachiella faecimaris]SMD32412.1 CubicO group peptidase, beta-lactamase class C family [Reichenbachiella faecimaris]
MNRVKHQVFCSIVIMLMQLGCIPKKDSKHEIATTNSLQQYSDLDQYIEGLIEGYQIGGAIAIGVVKDGEVVEEKVFGYEDFENQKKADLNTKFYIASMTKSFIGTLMKLMEDRGELDLKTKMNDCLKINFPSGMQTNEITLEDLLIHTSGLQNTSVAIKTAYTGNFTQDELIQDLETSTGQRGLGTYDYTNLGYILSGMALEQLTQKGWKQLLYEDIFRPLDMKSTSAYLQPSASVESASLLALPHTYSNGSIRTGSFMKRDDTMHAAGGLITTVADMNKWLMAHLDTSNNAYFTRAVLDDIHTDRIDFYDKSAGINNYGYGLGWEQGDWHEYDISWHGGGYPGYVSVHALVREENLGVVIMMSQQSRAIELILNYILAEQLGVDNAKELDAMEESIRVRTKRYRHYKDSIFQSVDSEEIKNVSLEKFVGRYVSDQLNQLVVKAKNQQLILQLGNLLFIGEYIGDDKFLIKSEVDDSFDVVDFYHLNSADRESYLEMFGQKFYKGQNN